MKPSNAIVAVNETVRVRRRREPFYPSVEDVEIFRAGYPEWPMYPVDGSMATADLPKAGDTVSSRAARNDIRHRVKAAGYPVDGSLKVESGEPDPIRSQKPKGLPPRTAERMPHYMHADDCPFLIWERGWPGRSHGEREMGKSHMARIKKYNEEKGPCPKCVCGLPNRDEDDENDFPLKVESGLTGSLDQSEAFVGRASENPKFWVSPKNEVVWDGWGEHQNQLPDGMKIWQAKDAGWVRGYRGAGGELGLDLVELDRVEDVLKALPPEWLFVRTLWVESVTEDVNVTVGEGEDALDAWKHRKDIRHRVKAEMMEEGEKAWVTSSGDFEEVEPGSTHRDWMFDNGIATPKDMKKLEDTDFEDDDFLFHRAHAKGLARVWFTQSELGIVLGNGQTVEKVMEALPTEWLLTKNVVVSVEPTGEPQQIPVLEGEDALDAWKHRKDIRHRVKAAGFGYSTRFQGSPVKFWISPDNKYLPFKGGEHENQDIIRSAFPMAKTWDKSKNSSTDSIIPIAIKAGWVRGGVTNFKAYNAADDLPWNHDLGLDANSEERVTEALTVIPQEHKFVRFIEVTILGRSLSVPVLEGEDALDAWKKRNDIRHRVKASADSNNKTASQIITENYDAIDALCQKFYPNQRVDGNCIPINTSVGLALYELGYEDTIQAVNDTVFLDYPIYDNETKQERDDFWHLWLLVDGEVVDFAPDVFGKDAVIGEYSDSPEGCSLSGNNPKLVRELKKLLSVSASDIRHRVKANASDEPFPFKGKASLCPNCHTVPEGFIRSDKAVTGGLNFGIKCPNCGRETLSGPAFGRMAWVWNYWAKRGEQPGVKASFQALDSDEMAKGWIDPDGDLIEVPEGSLHYMTLMSEEDEEADPYGQRSHDILNDAAASGWTRLWYGFRALGIDLGRGMTTAKALSILSKQRPEWVFVKTLYVDNDPSGPVEIIVDEGEDAESAWAHRNSIRKTIKAMPLRQEPPGRTHGYLPGGTWDRAARELDLYKGVHVTPRFDLAASYANNHWIKDHADRGVVLHIDMRPYKEIAEAIDADAHNFVDRKYHFDEVIKDAGTNADPEAFQDAVMDAAQSSDEYDGSEDPYDGPASIAAKISVQDGMSDIFEKWGAEKLFGVFNGTEKSPTKDEVYTIFANGAHGQHRIMSDVLDGHIIGASLIHPFNTKVDFDSDIEGEAPEVDEEGATVFTMEDYPYSPKVDKKILFVPQDVYDQAKIVYHGTGLAEAKNILAGDPQRLKLLGYTGYQAKFWISPTGDYHDIGTQEHVDAIVDLGIPEGLKPALQLGWTRGGFDNGYLYIETWEESEIEAILMSIPEELKARAENFAVDSGITRSVRVDDGESVEHAWRTRDGIRKRVAAAWVDEGFVDGNWGSSASGILFLSADNRILLLKRSGAVADPGTWGIPGGAIPVDDKTGKKRDSMESAMTEVEEELGGVPAGAEQAGVVTFEKGDFTFQTSLFRVPASDFEAGDLGWESDNAAWFPLSELPSPLHPGVKWAIGRLGLKASIRAKQFDDLRKAAIRLIEDDPSWKSLLDNPASAQAYGDLQQGLQDARTPEELQQAWESHMDMAWDIVLDEAEN